MEYTANQICELLGITLMTFSRYLKKLGGGNDFIVSSHKNKRLYSPEIIGALQREGAGSIKPKKQAPKMRITDPAQNNLAVLPPENWAREKVEYGQVVLISEAVADGIDPLRACQAAGLSLHSFLAAVMANRRYKEIWYDAFFRWRTVHSGNLERGLYAVLNKLLNTEKKVKTMQRFKPTAVGIDAAGEVIYARELVEEITTIEDYIPSAGELSLIKKMIEDMATITGALEEQEKAAYSDMSLEELDAEIRRLEGGG
jgi:hypothetical protein